MPLANNIIMTYPGVGVSWYGISLSQINVILAGNIVAHMCLKFQNGRQ